MPFAAIVCFTDHCDFDTLSLLQQQRNFFKKNNIKITKGFFLNHFSKRTDNASYERDFEELKKWQTDGHELAYHSLSQSIKSDAESRKDFFEFEPVFNATTWIDHGFQPYNLSLYQNNSISDADFARTLATKNIQILWNYIDSGTATCGVLNQLNPDNFTLQSFWLGTKKQSFQTRIALMVKIILVHFYNNEKLIQSYTKVASSFKKALQKKTIFEFYMFVKPSCVVIFPLLKVILFWNSYKNKVFANAKYCPLFFHHTIDDTKFTIFQSLELLDFKSSFEPKSIDKFVVENGIFIGHTYFSVPLEYHNGRLFDNHNNIAPTVTKNFDYLGTKIENSEIWNPTLWELHQHWNLFHTTQFEVCDSGKIEVKVSNSLIFKSIQ